MAMWQTYVKKTKNPLWNMNIVCCGMVPDEIKKLLGLLLTIYGNISGCLCQLIVTKQLQNTETYLAFGSFTFPLLI